MDLNKILKNLELLQNDSNFLVMLEAATYMKKLESLVEEMLPSYYGKNQTFNNKIREFSHDVVDNYTEKVDPFYGKLYAYYTEKMGFQDNEDDIEYDIIYDCYTIHNDTNRLFEELKQHYIECSQVPEGYVQLTSPDGTKELIPEEEFDALFK